MRATQFVLASGALLIGLLCVDNLTHSAAPRSAVTASSFVDTASSAVGPEGIAALYPADKGISRHRNVMFSEDFEQSALDDLFARWTSVRNESAMSFAADAPTGSAGARSLSIRWQEGRVNAGGHLYKQLTPGVDRTLYVRYYIKYPGGGGYTHTGVWMGGYNPPLSWPNPRSGVKPAGDDRFIAAAEQNTQTSRFDHYNYWVDMRRSVDGNYWGNLLLNNPDVQADADRWTCVEHMVKLNDPVTANNGEHAIWLNGVKVSHLGQGFPRGSWSGGVFTQDSSGSPFEGFRWRTDANLNLNWIWLQNYAPGDRAGSAGIVKFDHLVVATTYVGCLRRGVAEEAK